MFLSSFSLIILLLNTARAMVNEETQFNKVNIVQFEVFFHGVCSQEYDITFACRGK